MPIFTADLPLALYVHLPWCVRKCPYCDFNSHAASGTLPEAEYANTLLAELDTHLDKIQGRPLISIFFGGGTPSLFSGAAIDQILDGIAKRMALAPKIEITLEANPGTVDESRFQDFRLAGVNRLSLGLQSLQNDKLLTLGRIHNRDHALRAATLAKEAGFDNVNLDLMFGLPHQSVDDALEDLRSALAFEPAHLSWYQLTIEPNTLFYHQTPPLPVDDLIWEMQLAGQSLLKEEGLAQYEVSAYARAGHQCAHNRNYWEFGDYLGIGAGAHSKITDQRNHSIYRFAQVKNPRDYLNTEKRAQPVMNAVKENDAIFEFMLNALRLTDGFPTALFIERTGLALTHINDTLEQATARGLLIHSASRITPTEMGKKFLNDLIQMFLLNIHP